MFLQVLEYIKKNINSKKVELVSFDSDSPAPQPKPHTLPIDSFLDEFSVSVSGINSTLNVYEPDGDLASPPKLKNMLNLTNLKVVNVEVRNFYDGLIDSFPILLTIRIVIYLYNQNIFHFVVFHYV